MAVNVTAAIEQPYRHPHADLEQRVVGRVEQPLFKLSSSNTAIDTFEIPATDGGSGDN